MTEVTFQYKVPISATMRFLRFLGGKCAGKKSSGMQENCPFGVPNAIKLAEEAKQKRKDRGLPGFIYGNQFGASFYPIYFRGANLIRTVFDDSGNPKMTEYCGALEPETEILVNVNDFYNYGNCQ